MPKGRGLWIGLAVVLLLALVAVAAVVMFFMSSLGGGSGGLLVESEPSGASVLINGRLVGATPISLKGLSHGTYGVRLEKSGCTSVNVKIDVPATGSARVREKLPPVALGTLTVNIRPDDAEVLLDGELMGHTPLKLANIPVGPHDLLVRKTNCSSYSQHVEIEPNKESLFKDVELADRILELLEGQVKAEPQRVGHYIDLAHYYFVNDRMGESVEAFVKGQEVMNTPLNFDGPGYQGRDKMSPEEIAIETRLRSEDISRYSKELEKHRSFPRKDTRAFRMKLMEAMDFTTRRDMRSWPRAERAAQDQIRNRNYDRAARIYSEHIRAAANTPDLPKAYSALIEVYCMQPDVDKAAEEFGKFFALFGKDGPSLRMLGNTIYPYYERVEKKAARDKLLGLAEKALRTGLELPCDNNTKAQTLFDLGMSLFYQDRFKDAVPVLAQSVETTRSDSLKEDRNLRLAEALRKSGDKAGATELFKKLQQSERPHVRESANYGLIAIKQSDAK